jgi:class 3 adenylate cyclase
VLATILRTGTADRVLRAEPDGQPDAFQAASGQQVVGHRGQLISSDPGSTLAIFDAPGQAIRCAAALRDTAAAHGIEVRAGIHTDEVDLAGIAGTSVHITDEVAALAQPTEILVSRTVKDLVAGPSIGFISRGRHQLGRSYEVFGA